MKTHVLWCSAAAVCLATCVHAFAAEGPSHPPSPGIRPEPVVRLALLDANPHHEADPSQYREHSAVLNDGVADVIRLIEGEVPVDLRSSRRTTPLMAATSIALLALAHRSTLVARASTHALQGLFCNSAEQIDETVTHMRKGLSPRAAVELVNREAVVCTFVDLLRYIVDRPVVIKEIPGSFQLFKYEGTLVGVVVGGAVRPVTPPVHIFFAIPERLDDAPLEGRV